MCGRFVSLTWDEVKQVVKSIELDTPYNPEPDYPATRMDAYPKSVVPVIVQDGAHLKPQELRWGFEAPWDKNKIIFNTRIETAVEKEGMWNDAIAKGRCIVPTFGFFEPSSTETVISPKTGKSIKKQYEFSLPGQLTLLAGVRDADSFSVVTTRPNEIMAPIHQRMPIVIRSSEVDQWLHGDFASLANRNGVELRVSGA